MTDDSRVMMFLPMFFSLVDDKQLKSANPIVKKLIILHEKNKMYTNILNLLIHNS